jgi:hypothetical protein
MLVEQQGLAERTICNAVPYIRVEILHGSGHLISKSSGWKI